MDDAFGHWFAGFVDGEGCFTIKKRLDFEIWKEAVRVWGRGDQSQRDPSRWAEMGLLKQQLQIGRRLAPG